MQIFAKFANFADPPNSAEVQHQLAAIGREKLLELSDCLDAFVAPEFLGGTSRVTKVAVEGHRGPTIGKIPANCCSFSAVSAPIFARKNTPALRARGLHTKASGAFVIQNLNFYLKVFK